MKKQLNITINLDDVKEKIVQELNTHWLQIPDHPYRTVIAGGSGSRRKNALLNLVNW